MPKIYMKTGRNAGKSYALSGPCILGRGDEAQIKVYDGKASREHCRVFQQGGQWVVVDLNSRNGITVNGVSKTRHTLRLGDEIAIGETIAVFQARSSEKASDVAKQEPRGKSARSGPPEMSEAQKKAKAERDKAFAAARKDAGGGGGGGGARRRQKGPQQTGADGGVTISKNALQYNKEKESALGFDLGQMPIWQQLVVALLAIGLLVGLGYGLSVGLG